MDRLRVVAIGLLDLAGLMALVAAAWLFAPPLGLAVIGAGCLSIAYSLTPRRP